MLKVLLDVEAYVDSLSSPKPATGDILVRGHVAFRLEMLPGGRRQSIRLSFF